MKRTILITAAAAVAGLGLWIGFKPVDWQTWLGFTKADYFTTGQNYALYSGFLPCFLTTLGMSTIITGLWHAKNCHADGCWKIGRHHINGTPWCNDHEADARQEKTVEQLLAEQNALLQAMLHTLIGS